MKIMSNVSSEEELLQLREEGKINEAEYQDLLTALKETGRPETEPAGRERSEPAKISGLAIASLVLALALGPLGCVPAVICGHLALRRINREPALGGRGLALAGLIIGYIVLAASLVLYGLHMDAPTTPTSVVKAPPPTTELRRFALDDTEGLISRAGAQTDKQISSDGNGLLRIGPPKRMTICLFETGDIDIQDARFIYQARLQMDARRKAILDKLQSEEISVIEAQDKLERLSGG